MNKDVSLLVASLLALTLALAGCGAPAPDENALASRVAATIYAGQTARPGGAGEPTPAARANPAPPGAPHPLGTAARTATPTPTPRPTRTPTSTPSATPLPDALVSSQAANLRAGPGTVYEVVGQARQGDELRIAGKSPDGGWLEVTLPDGTRGWMSASLLAVNLDLGQVAVAAIPPTPTPAETPTPTLTPVPRVCPSGPALVEVKNDLGTSLALRLSGAEEVTMSIPARTTARYCLTPGEYVYSAAASGYTTQTGRKAFSALRGSCDCWRWYAGVLAQVYMVCQCDPNPALYAPAALVAGARPAQARAQPTQAAAQASQPPAQPTQAAAQPAEPAPQAARCPNPGVCISQPGPQATISGQVHVMGTANIDRFHHYKLEWWGEGATGWNYLLERDKPVVDGELMMLDTRTVPAGRYGLRLTVVDQTGNYPEPFEIWWTVSR
jgi:hypothetical protein